MAGLVHFSNWSNNTSGGQFEWVINFIVVMVGNVCVEICRMIAGGHRGLARSAAAY